MAGGMRAIFEAERKLREQEIEEGKIAPIQFDLSGKKYDLLKSYTEDQGRSDVNVTAKWIVEKWIADKLEAKS